MPGREREKQKARAEIPARAFQNRDCDDQSVRIAVASGPLAPWTTSIQMVWPSASCITPARCKADACTNTSFPPSAGATKPKPLVALYHLTVPCISTDGPVGAPRRGAPPLGLPPKAPAGPRGAPPPALLAEGVAVLSSTDSTSETWRPFWPWP